MKLPRPIRGIVTPMLTPLHDTDRLDVASLERLIEHLIQGRVSGIFILGSTGEAPGLSYRLRKEVIDEACNIVGDRAPVFVGITDTSFVESLNLAEYSCKKGVSAVVLSPPCYYSLSQQMFLGYLERLCPKLPLPMYLYNIPKLTKLKISPETVRISADLPNVYGLKDSSGDRDYFLAAAKAVSDHPEYALLVGVEEVLAEYIGYGGHGGVCGGSNLYPELYVRICELALSGEEGELEPLQEKVRQISSGVYNVGESESSYLRGLKCAASILGLCSPAMAEPYAPLTASERSQIRENLLKIKIPGLTVS